jgi:hypothetical protein
MRNVYAILLGLCLSIAMLMPAFAQQATSCQLNSDGEIVTDANGYADCVMDDGEQLLKLQYLGLCEAVPSPSNYLENCTTIFNDVDGREILLSRGSLLDLFGNNDISLSEGSYTHAVIRIDSLIQIRGQYSFDKQLLGGAGGIGKQCWTAATGTSGTYSDIQDYYGYTALSQLATECGSDPAPEFIIQDFKTFTGPTGPTNTISGRSSPSGPYEMYSLKSPSELASEDQNNLDGEHLLGIQTFQVPVVISPETKNIDFGFKMEDMFHIQTNWQSTLDPFDTSVKRSPDGVGLALPTECGKYRFGGNSCLKYVIPMGFEFSASAS